MLLKNFFIFLCCFVPLLMGCTEPNMEMASLGKKLAAPTMKGSVFDQDVKNLHYARFAGSCDKRIKELSVNFTISLNPNAINVVIDTAKAAVFLSPPLAPDVTGINTLDSTIVNDFDCSDGKFDFYLTMVDVVKLWGFDPLQNNIVVSEVKIKGTTVIGDTHALVMLNPNTASGSLLSAPLITFFSSFSNTTTTPAMFFIPSVSNNIAVDHYEMRVLRASDKTVVQDWTMVNMSGDISTNILFLDGLNLTPGEFYTPQLRAIDTSGLATFSASSTLTWRALTNLAVGFGSNQNGILGLGNTDVRSSVLSPRLVVGGKIFSQVVVGGSSTCALEEGTQKAFCWGANWQGGLGNSTLTESYHPVAVTAPFGGTVLSFSEIVAGNDHNCGLEVSTGKAYCWGYNWYGQIGNNSFTNSTVPAPVAGAYGGSPLSFKQISAGESHTCGIESTNGYAYCWGNNNNGQLGDNSTLTSATPVAVSLVGGLYISFSQISAGSWHTCGIEAGTGKAYCWGANFNGQLGDSSYTDRFIPTQIYTAGSVLNFSQIAAGESHTCGIETGTGHAYCWGSNIYGQLGDGTNTLSPVPVLVFGNSFFSKVSVGSSSTCGIESNSQKAYCWGANWSGQLGNDSNLASTTPVAVVGVSGGAAISFLNLEIGGSHTCGVDVTSKKTYCWGSNSDGQLGQNAAEKSIVPTAVLGLNGSTPLNFSDLTVGGSHACGIEISSQKGYCWGANWSGQLGNNSTVASRLPIPILGSGGGPAISFSQIAAGNSHTCGIEAGSGNAYCWGNGFYGELGNNTNSSSGVPVAVLGPGGGAALLFSQIAAGSSHTCAIEVGTEMAYCWGNGFYGELGNNTNSSSGVPVAVLGPGGGAALLFSQIAAGSSHTCAIEVGTEKAYCWGQNFNGQLGDGSVINSNLPVAVAPFSGSVINFAQLQAGSMHTCGIEAVTGRSYCWGSNMNGQLGDETYADKNMPVPVLGYAGGSALQFSQMAVGSFHTCAIEAFTEKTYCWGNNWHGQLGDNSRNSHGSPVPVINSATSMRFKKIKAGGDTTIGLIY